MVQYKDLNKMEQQVFEELEAVFIKRKDLSRKSFVRVLGLMINKYKIKG